MQIKELFYSVDFFVSAAKVDKANVCIFKRKFYETVILFLGKDTIILGSSLEVKIISSMKISRTSLV